MNYFILLGVLIIVVGFAFKLDSLSVVLFAGVVTALIGGLDFSEILRILGESFVNNRLMSLFFLTLPVVGISERYGLRERAVALIQGMKVATTGRVLSVYLFFREVASAMSLRLGGHPQFVRPLVEPMAEGAAAGLGVTNEDTVDVIKGGSAAAENYGNFFAQNLFIAAPGVLLIIGTLREFGYDVQAADVALWSVPVAIAAFIVGSGQFHLLDRQIERQAKDKDPKDTKKNTKGKQ
jgi:uncharacterized membrane protein